MSTTDALAAIRKTLTVDASLETAFETFTKRMDDWWPRGAYTVFDDRVAVLFEEEAGGRVYERSPNGEEAPRRFVLRWRINPEGGPTEVEVRFTPENGATRVDLEHRGWDQVGDADGRAMYASGWDTVLGGYSAAVNR
jgi:hypothetical protein